MVRKMLMSKNVQEVLIIKCGIVSILEEFIEGPLDLTIHVPSIVRITNSLFSYNILRCTALNPLQNLCLAAEMEEKTYSFTLTEDAYLAESFTPSPLVVLIFCHKGTANGIP